MQRVMGILLAAAVSGAACAEQFSPFNEVNELRILGVRAEPPALLEGESSTFDALVYVPVDASVSEPLSYRWSWCPMTLGSATGFECAVTEEDLRQGLDEAAPGASAFLPSYDLGNAETASFSYFLPAAALRTLCDAIASGSAPAFIELPTCTDSFNVTVRLEVSRGESTLVAVKQLSLLLEEEAAPNENPVIGDLFFARADGNGDPVEPEIPVVPGEPSALRADTSYALSVSIPESSAETYTPAPGPGEEVSEPKRETLFMTWFVTGGETKWLRTGFIDGVTSMEELSRNEWDTPKLDETPGIAELILVLQDARGGATWSRAPFVLEGGAR